MSDLPPGYLWLSCVGCIAVSSCVLVAAADRRADRCGPGTRPRPDARPHRPDEAMLSSKEEGGGRSMKRGASDVQQLGSAQPRQARAIEAPGRSPGSAHVFRRRRCFGGAGFSAEQERAGGMRQGRHAWPPAAAGLSAQDRLSPPQAPPRGESVSAPALPRS